MSDKPFKENTKNVLLPDTPLPLRFNNIQDAYAELETEINDFFIVFKNEIISFSGNNFYFGVCVLFYNFYKRCSYECITYII